MFTPASAFTHETAAQQLSAGIAAIDSGQSVFSFEQTGQIDSSAVACLLAWKRHALVRKVKLEFQHLPENLNHLIQLYGVAELM
jgi:phospholipid transport system transporter-binding protein